MDAATQTPCSQNFEMKDDDENHKRCIPQLTFTPSSARPIPNFLDTPRSISSASQSWSLNHLFHSQEPFPRCEYHQQWDQPIYLNDDHHDLALTSNPDQVLIPPLNYDDTKKLPHAQYGRENLDQVDNGLAVSETDQAELPNSIMAFFSRRNRTIQRSPGVDKAYLDNFLLNDLSIIMDLSVPACSSDGHRLFSNYLPVLEQPLLHPPTTPIQSYTCRLLYPQPPCVITNHSDPERPYVCDRCHQKYTRPQDCTRHIKAAHIKAKNFICRQAGCISSFSRSDSLKRHIRNIHHLSNK